MRRAQKLTIAFSVCYAGCMDVTLNISLPQALTEWLENRARATGGGTPSAVLEDLIRQEQARDDRRRLEEHLVRVVDGPAATPMTKMDWDRIRAEGRRLVEERQRG